MNWKCPQCDEELDETFDSCWQCGTGCDGAPPPAGFDDLVESTPGDREPDSASPDQDEELARSFKCVKCEHREADVERVAMLQAGIFTSYSRNEFIAVSCEKCGYTEFFKADLSSMGKIMRKLFGS